MLVAGLVVARLRHVMSGRERAENKGEGGGDVV